MVMRTNRQIEASKKAGIATVCASFVILLLMVLLLEGMPTTGQLVNIVLGSLFMGFWGYQLGTVMASPTVVKRKTHTDIKKNEQNPFYEERLKTTQQNTTDDATLESGESEEATGLDALQNAIPTQGVKTSEHEWREIPNIDADDDANKTKAFEA
jgi:hypothetical protein